MQRGSKENFILLVLFLAAALLIVTGMGAGCAGGAPGSAKPLRARSAPRRRSCLGSVGPAESPDRLGSR
jgi:hypothetical protein